LKSAAKNDLLLAHRVKKNSIWRKKLVKAEFLERRKTIAGSATSCHTRTVQQLGRWTRDRKVRGSWSGRYQVHGCYTWMGDCLWTGKPSWYITNTKANSAFHPFGKC